jgi:hypothetical protein
MAFYKQIFGGTGIAEALFTVELIVMFKLAEFI